MQIHFLAPKDKTKWKPIWNKCYSIWEKTPHDLKVWDDEEIDELIKNDDREFYEVLNTLDPIYKFDFVRLIILEKYGGAYFDMDVELLQDFLQFLDPKKIYLSEGAIFETVSNHIMISPPGERWWTLIKHHVKHKIFKHLERVREHNEFEVIEMVGPIALSRFVCAYKMPFDLLAWEHFSSKTNSISFARHHYTNSWWKNNVSPSWIR